MINPVNAGLLSKCKKHMLMLLLDNTNNISYHHHSSYQSFNSDNNNAKLTNNHKCESDLYLFTLDIQSMM